MCIRDRASPSRVNDISWIKPGKVAWDWWNDWNLYGVDFRHRPILYNQMLLSEKLYPHLIEIDETAQSRLEQMMPQLAKEAGATEELKASDPMKWVGLMNNCKAQAEEILMAELINS